MPLATPVSFAKGRNKGACHRTVLYPSTSSTPCPTLPTSNLTRPRISPNHPRLGRLPLFFFLSSSLNYWKQNGLRTKTQADVGWLIMARPDWRPCQMKNGLEKLLSRKIRGTCCPSLRSPFFYFARSPSHPFPLFFIVPKSRRDLISDLSDCSARRYQYLLSRPSHKSCVTFLSTLENYSGFIIQDSLRRSKNSRICI